MLSWNNNRFAFINVQASETLYWRLYQVMAFVNMDELSMLEFAMYLGSKLRVSVLECM